ncbi:MAG: putative Ig domain-containing protein, partial [Acidobacteriota bacterium]
MKFRRDSARESSRFSNLMKVLSRRKLAIACTLIAICFVIGAEPRKAAALIRKHQSFFPTVTVGKLYDMFAAGTGLVRVQDPVQPAHKPRWRQSDDPPAGSDTTAQGPPLQLSPNAPALGSDSCPGTSIASLPFSDSDTTVGANNTVAAIPGGCSTYTTVQGPDKIYTFNVVTAGSLTVTATPSGGTYDLATYLISSCPGGTGNAVSSGCIKGADVVNTNTVETFTVSNLALGTYYLYVDSFYSSGGKSSGPYSLSVTGTAVLGSGCTITCPTNITTANDPNQCGAVVTYPAPTTSGSCGTVTCSPASGSFFPVGTTTVNCTDGGGAGFGLKAAPEAASGCSFTVTINDTQPPATPVCPANITIPNTPNQCGAVATYATPTTSDNCPGSSVTCSPPSGSFFPVGTSSVTCTATDASPNSADSSCGFTVTVNDTQAPTITCPANITAPNDPNQCGAVVTYTTPTGSDNCNGAAGLRSSPQGEPSPVTVNCSPASGSFFPVGMTTVTCTASDASPNSPDSTCAFTVLVEDTQPPVITCPANVTVPNDPNQCGAVATYPNPVITDNCPSEFGSTCIPPSGSFFPVGTTTVTCTVGGGGGGGCPTLTESSSQTITASNSVSCNNGVGHTDNSYWRAFTLSSFGVNNAFNVQSIDIGVETASSSDGKSAPSRASSISKNGQKAGSASLASAVAGPGQSITVRIYISSQAFPAGFPGSLTLIGTASTTVSDQAGTIINVPITGTAPGGSQLVVEVFTPDGTAAGNLFYFGSNSSPETAPSYITAAECGITTPATTAEIGSPNMHIVMNVNGCEASSEPMPSCTFSVTVTNAAPVLTYASPQTVFVGQGTTINPATGPSDTNPSTITVQSVGGGFSGTVTVDNTTGVVTITNATPTGSFLITIRATDTCGTTTDATFTLNVVCPAITVNPASLPGGTIGVGYSQTISAVPAGVYSFTVTSGGLPIGLSLNAGTGVISGTPTQGGTYSFRITATSGFNCTGFRDYTVTIVCPAITLSTPLPPATAGIAYSASVAASPEGSYIYTVVLGTLPYGLTLGSSTGTISGLPTVAGTFNFTIRADAGNGCVGTQAYTMVVGCPTITVLPNTLPNGTVGTGYSQTLSATPVTGSYSFAVASGSLPPGLSLITTGLLSGTPTANGTFNFSITATAFGTCTSAPKSYSITIGAAGCPTITLPDIAATGTIGSPYNQSVAASPSAYYTYALTGATPPGVTFYNAAALLYGYPTTNGVYNFTITATNSSNCTGSKSYTVTIGAGFARAVANDFDGDGKSDPVVWDGIQSQWEIANSGDGKQQIVQLSE